MAMPKSRLSPVPWEKDGFLRVKMEEEEASLFQVQESSFGHTIHPEAAYLRFRHFCFEEALARLRELCRQWLRPEAHSEKELLALEQFLGAMPPRGPVLGGRSVPQAWQGSRCAGGGPDSGTGQERGGGDCRCSQRTGAEPGLEREGADLDLGFLTETLTHFGKQVGFDCQ